jgi:hypothetical protein
MGVSSSEMATWWEALPAPDKAAWCRMAKPGSAGKAPAPLAESVGPENVEALEAGQPAPDWADVEAGIWLRPTGAKPTPTYEMSPYLRAFIQAQYECQGA